MGIVRDITVEQLTQAIGGIDTSGLAKDTTLQATNTALGNINTTLGGITTNDPPTDTTQQSIATAITNLGTALGSDKANIDGSNIADKETFRTNIGACASDKTLTISFFCSYPNGKEFGSANTAVTIPCYNPLNTSKSVGEAYVYDSNGNYADIKSTIASCQSSINGFVVRFTFNSNHVGKLLRLVIY